MAEKKDDPATGSVPKVTYFLRDFNPNMSAAWHEEFSAYEDAVKVSTGDIFQGAPAADAIVSPANSFGFMDGGIDLVYSRHFGWQMQRRLQDLIRKRHGGEIPVGQAVIIKTFEDGTPAENLKWVDDPNFNEGKLIKFLICAPTMRVPMDVADTPNAYLAFRAIIRAVKEYNATHQEPIGSVLCPGLGTAVGRMPFQRCASQMKIAYEACELGIVDAITNPKDLREVSEHHYQMAATLESRYITSHSMEKLAFHTNTLDGERSYKRHQKVQAFVL